MKKSFEPRGGLIPRRGRGRGACVRPVRLGKHGGRQRQNECAHHSESVRRSIGGYLAHWAGQYFHAIPTCKAREFFRSGLNRKKSLSRS